MGDSEVRATDRAIAGSGAAANYFPQPADVLGGAGGHADSSAFGANQGAAPVTVSARADGGAGGRSVGSGLSGTVGGGASATARGESRNGEVDVSATAVGGRGGDGGDGGQGGPGGGGAGGLSYCLVQAGGSVPTGSGITLCVFGSAGAPGSSPPGGNDGAPGANGETLVVP